MTIITTNDAVRKLRKITIFKQQVYQDIDSHTYKFAEANKQADIRVENAISSDATEMLDGSIEARLVQYRDAELRKFLYHALADNEDEEADNKPDAQDKFVYDLALPVGVKDVILKPLAMQIHKYLVWGALFDWYAEIGSSQAAVYKGELAEIEAELTNMLRTPSVAKRPLSPFGPAKKLF